MKAVISPVTRVNTAGRLLFTHDTAVLALEITPDMRPVVFVRKPVIFSMPISAIISCKPEITVACILPIAPSKVSTLAAASTATGSFPSFIIAELNSSAVI